MRQNERVQDYEDPCLRFDHFGFEWVWGGKRFWSFWRPCCRRLPADSLTLWVQRVLLGREEEEELVGWGGGEEENTSWGKSLIWIWEEVIFPNDGSKHERWKALSLFSCSPPLQPLLCNQSFSQKKTFNGIRAGGYIFTSEWRKCEEKWKFRRKSGTSETRGENLRKSKNWGEKWKLRMAAAMLRTLLISLHLHNLTRFEQNS